MTLRRLDRDDWRQRRAARVGGFTLVELLVVISIIALLASIVMFAMAGAQETARRDRTRAQIARIHSLLSERWESYLTRRVSRPVEYGPTVAAEARVHAIRDLMRMELPDRKADLATGRRPEVSAQEPALWFAYQRKIQRLIQRFSGKAVTPEVALAAWSTDNESAECLYLILSQLSEGDKTALAYFSEREIGDRDNDGIPEILDAWGNPIKFIRWAPGFGMKDLDNDGEYETLDVAAGYQDRDAPDPFDPRRVFAQAGTFALFPLVYSAGPDKLYEIYDPANLVYRQTNPPNNPFLGVGAYTNAGPPVGCWQDANNDRRDNSVDNIHNHLLIAGG